MIAGGKTFSTKQKIFTRNRWLMDWNAGHRHATPETAKLHHHSSPLILVKHLHDTLARIRISVQRIIRTAMVMAMVMAMVTEMDSIRRIRKRRTRGTLRRKIPGINLLVLMRNPFVL